MAMNNGMMFNTDSYNSSHFQMFPPGTTEISGYIEARNNSEFQNISFFGLQYFIKKYLMEPDLSNMDVHAAKMRWWSHGEPFPRKGWQKIKELGYYPIEIQAVPEGSWVPKGNVLIQIRNTDPDCYWLPTWLETQLVQIWYPIAVATQSKQTKAMLRSYLENTGCENIEGVLPFMEHDFGYRGCSCYEQASIGGAAHLTNFKGTDTFPALDLIKDYYNCEMAGYSIPASNHAVITSWGKENEENAFENVLNHFLIKDGVVACVSDSYDFYKALDTWGTRFKDRIMNSGGRLVIRPDSGTAETVTLKGLLKLLDYFGYTTTRTGHKLLPSCVRMIWGDGINPKTIDSVLYNLDSYNIAAENMVFGMGSALLQEVKRDQASIAFKVNERVTNGIRYPVNKEPVTGKGKASKAGRQALVNCDGYTFTLPETQLEGRKNLLRTVFKDGKLLIDDDFETIRTRTDQNKFEYYGVI
jgi:nicotinamide phosphoribosyltransferase